MPAKASAPEPAWNAARLIPTSGINGSDEQERRATSALLAVMSAVRDFGKTLTQPLGAPAASLETFIEVPFTIGERRVYPDGLIRATRGAKGQVPGSGVTADPSLYALSAMKVSATTSLSVSGRTRMRERARTSSPR